MKTPIKMKIKDWNLSLEHFNALNFWFRAKRVPSGFRFWKVTAGIHKLAIFLEQIEILIRTDGAIGQMKNHRLNIL
uniref:Uncharacterized protein n=1 Tax=Rhizophora mucronata TaxID=61149 RepID=A0A2P2PS42_RHIMU